MNYDLCSDLHIDSYLRKNERGVASVDFVRLKNADSDVLVVAGDTANHYSRLFKLLHKATAYYEWVVFVEGNHEHYESRRPINITERRLREFTERHPKLIYLDGKNFLRIDDTVFVGVNGWYDWKIVCPDFSYADQLLEWSGEYKGVRKPLYSGSSDRYIVSRDIPVAEVIVGKAKLQATWLKEQVQQFSADPTVRNIVVTTHTAPARFCLDEHLFDEEWQRLLGSYANSQFQEVLNVPQHKIKIWNFGHIHNRKQLTLDGVDFVNNSRGYASQQLDRPPFKIIQLKSSGL